MPKRLCPFDCDLMPQLKTHVSEKEIILCNNKSLEKVFSKTIEMLFNGSKNLDCGSENKHENKLVNMLGKNECIPKIKFKQTFLSANGKIQTVGEIKDIPVNTCTSCRINSIIPSNKCSFCEKSLCLDCAISCCQCLDNFCKICSTTLYYSQKNVDICLTCAYNL